MTDSTRPTLDVGNVTYSPGIASCDASWKALRSECPVAWFEDFGGFWAVARYDDNALVLQDNETFSSARTHAEVLSTAIPPMQVAWPLIPEELDQPEFAPYRRIVASMLSPTAVQQMGPTIAWP